MRFNKLLDIDIVQLPLPKTFTNKENKTFDLYSFREENSQIKAIIAHCVGLPTINEAISVFKESGVSAHYIVPQISGTELKALMPEEFENYKFRFPDKAPVIQLVQDHYKAFHAGISRFGDLNNEPGCKRGLNACTIGIEFHAPGYGIGDDEDKKWYSFASYTELQKETGIELIKYLMEVHRIPSNYLLAHSTIAVGRKTDPGPLFFWKDLNKNGLGYLPEPENIKSLIKDDIASVQHKMRHMGFTDCPSSGELDEKTKDYLDAFTMQFATDLWEGKHSNFIEKLILRN